MVANEKECDIKGLFIYDVFLFLFEIVCGKYDIYVCSTRCQREELLVVSWNLLPSNIKLRSRSGFTVDIFCVPCCCTVI